MSGKSGKNYKGGAYQTFHVEEYQKIWKIPQWERVQRSVDSLRAQSFEFETGSSTRGQTKWSMGFKINPPNFRVYWKMIEEKGFPDGKVDATATCTLFTEASSVHWTDTQKMAIEKGQEIDVPYGLPVNATGWGPLLNQKGELTIIFELIIVEPDVPSVDVKLELFHERSVAEVHANFAKLLDDQSTADITIVTRDGKELVAHKAILKVQCPIFESIFRKEFSENKTGIVNVKDIGSKTMEICLHYFYSGELLPSWKDIDNVVEFTYAVGKYQLTSLLKLLDEILGSRDEEDATHADIQLLDLARKLGLENAEMELVERIKRTTNKASSGADLLALYGVENEKEGMKMQYE